MDLLVDCGDGFTGVYICQNLTKLCNLYTYHSLYFFSFFFFLCHLYLSKSPVLLSAGSTTLLYPPQPTQSQESRQEWACSVVRGAGCCVRYGCRGPVKALAGRELELNVREGVEQYGNCLEWGCVGLCQGMRQGEQGPCVLILEFGECWKPWSMADGWSAGERQNQLRALTHIWENEEAGVSGLELKGSLGGATPQSVQRMFVPERTLLSKRDLSCQAVLCPRNCTPHWNPTCTNT